MPLIYECQEIQPGRYRMICRGTLGMPKVDLCDCPDGHESEDTARRCLQAAVKLDAASPRSAVARIQPAKKSP